MNPKAVPFHCASTVAAVVQQGEAAARYSTRTRMVAGVNRGKPTVPVALIVPSAARQR